MNAEQAARLGAINPGGVLVDSLKKGGVAEQAGLHKHDIIVKAARAMLINSAQLRQVLALHSPGDRLLLLIKRGGSEFELTVVLAPTDNAGIAAQRSMRKYWPVMRTYHKE